MKIVVLIALVLLYLGCSDEELIEVRTINLSVNKTTGLAGADTIIIFAEVLDRLFAPIEGLPIEYFVDDAPLPSNEFFSVVNGTFGLSARYNDVMSNRVDVRIVSLDDPLDDLELLYSGAPFLTTSPWSVSSKFTHRIVINNQPFDIDNKIIPLFLDDQKIDQYSGINFSVPGQHTFHSEINGLRSNEIIIEVREDISSDVIEIPYVFHFYGVNPTSGEIRAMTDYMDNAFLPESISSIEVLEGIMDPNAISMYLRFVPASATPDGTFLSTPGINLIEPPGDDLPLPDSRRFDQLRKEHNWDPDEVVNIWLAVENDFDFENLPEGMKFGGRGFYSPPVLLNESLDGLNTIDVDTASNMDCIFLNAINVIGPHPDYLASVLGHYLGLFTTFEFGCIREGDYCADTPAPFDFSAEGPLGEFTSCDGYFFQPFNYMSIGGEYNHFTFDQRLRVRKVLKYALNRPSS